jgi:RimJ/RimL family protein N-acetyltransferase
MEQRFLDTPRGQLVLRPGQAEDAAAYRELRLEALVRHPEAYSGSYEASQAMTLEEWAGRLAFRASGENSGIIYFAVDEQGNLTGMSGIHLGSSSKTRHGGMVFGVYVQPEWCSYGVGGALVEACLDWARRQGARLARLGVTSNNAAAIRCYARLGFRVYGLDPQAINVEGVYHDLLLMVREL